MNSFPFVLVSLERVAVKSKYNMYFIRRSTTKVECCEQSCVSYRTEYYRGTNRKTLHIMAEAVNASLASSKYLEYFTRESYEQVRCNLCWEKKVSKK